MNLSFVIVNYNDYVTTKRLIDNIKDYKIIKEIVIVDNKSTDDSLRKLKALENNKITVIDSKENKGYSYAINIGCNYLIDKYNEIAIAISNSDIIIQSEDDLKQLLSYVNDSNVIVAPTIIEGNDVNRGWKLPKPKDDIRSNIPYFHKIFRKKNLLYRDEYYHKEISKVDVVSGCFFLINSNHFKKIGGMDENVFLYYEENILGAKTKILKKNIIVCNNIDVIHDHSVSVDKSIKRINKYNILKKSQYYFEKEYNNANTFELMLLKITAFLTRIVLFIKYLFRK